MTTSSTNVFLQLHDKNNVIIAFR